MREREKKGPKKARKKLITRGGRQLRPRRCCWLDCRSQRCSHSANARRPASPPLLPRYSLPSRTRPQIASSSSGSSDLVRRSLLSACLRGLCACSARSPHRSIPIYTCHTHNTRVDRYMYSHLPAACSARTIYAEPTHTSAAARISRSRGAAAEKSEKKTIEGSKNV